MNKSFITKRMGTKYQGKSHKQTIIGIATAGIYCCQANQGMKTTQVQLYEITGASIKLPSMLTCPSALSLPYIFILLAF